MEEPIITPNYHPQEQEFTEPDLKIITHNGQSISAQTLANTIEEEKTELSF